MFRYIEDSHFRISLAHVCPTQVEGGYILCEGRCKKWYHIWYVSYKSNSRTLTPSTTPIGVWGTRLLLHSAFGGLVRLPTCSILRYHSHRDKRLPKQFICFHCGLQNDKNWEIIKVQTWYEELLGNFSRLALFRSVESNFCFWIANN